MRFLFLFLLLPGSAGLWAQQLYGVVVDAGTGEPLPAVSVDNIRTGEHILSSEKGTYSIAIQSGDRVRFRLLGYTMMEFLAGSGSPEQYQRVPLERYLQRIDTVVVKPGLGAYQEDSLKRGLIFGKELAKKPSQFKFNRPHPLYGGTGSFNAPISSLIQKRTRKYKRLKAFQDRFRKNERQFFIDSRYTSSLVTELTGLTGDSLATFMNSYPMDYDYARMASDLEVGMWIRFNYRGWTSKEAARSEEQ